MTRFIFIVAILVLALCDLVARTSAQVNVTQKNNNPSRDGLYIDPAFTPSAMLPIWRVTLNFNGTIVGTVHAQPLYIEGGPNGPMIIVVTASNNIYALNATTGILIWQRNDIGPPVTSGLRAGIQSVWHHRHAGCRSCFATAFLRRHDRRGPKKHFIFSLNVDTGDTTAGWPVDLNATASYNGITFVSRIQNERGALALVNGIVYVPFSGHAGRLRHISRLGGRREHQ